MRLRLSSLRERARSPGGQKLIRYSMVSAVAAVIGQTALFLTFGVFRLWSATVCNVVAVCLGTVPSYYLNRGWVWKKAGRSHLLKEVVPFFALSFLGLGLSTWAVHVAQDHVHEFTTSHTGVALAINGASLTAFGVLWIAKFVIFNELMFKHRPAI